MRRIRSQTNYVVWHCSATKPDWNGHAADIANMHKAKGWDDIGYHIVISREGQIAWGEDPRKQGAHAKGMNMISVGVCLVGGVDESNAPQANYTPEQWVSAKATYEFLSAMYPAAEHLGHRDLSPDLNNDGIVDGEDMALFVEMWLSYDLLLAEDLDRNGSVNFSDFAKFTEQWFWEEYSGSYLQLPVH